MKFFNHPRSRTSLAAITIVAVATSAGAATVHRLAVTTTTGSLGATTFLQSTTSGGALQGEVASSARTSIQIPFGVLGEYDAMGTTFGAGVLGVSGTGYGVGAESFSKSQPSIIGINTTGGNGAEFYGEGASTLSTTSIAMSQGGAGLLASSTKGNAIEASSASDGVASIYAEDDAPDYGFGLYATSSNADGFGLYGYGSSGVGAESETTGPFFPSVYAYTGTPGTELYDGVVSPDPNSTGYEVFAFNTPSQDFSQTVDPQNTGVSTDLQINGDILLSGNIFTGCQGVPQETDATDDCQSTTTAIAKASNGTKYTAYTAKHASETMEDEGEARLVNGVAHVTLDTAFASTISTTQPYLVFTTPMGESRGLYVSNRTPSGFDVRENASGRSTMAFDYRIVAHPYGARVARMAPIVHKRLAKHPISAKALARLRMMQHGRAGRSPLKSHAMPRSFMSFAHTPTLR